MERIGYLRFLRRYPVKGMMGEDLDIAYVSKHGLAGDRVFAFKDENSENKRFPWMTARKRHEMILFKPRFLESTHPFTRAEVMTPEGAIFELPSVEFDEYLRKRFRYEMRLEYSDQGIKDKKPLSLVSLQTLDALKKELGMDSLRHERFRENFYVQWDRQDAFFENELVGKSIRIGESVISIDMRNARCVVPTLDPSDAVSSVKILNIINRAHDGCIGVYGIPETNGEVSVGDSVFLI